MIKAWFKEGSRMLEEFNYIRQQAIIGFAITKDKWLYIEYTDSDHQFTARLVKPIKFLQSNQKGHGFLAKCELRDSNYRHFKLHGIHKMVVVDNILTWNENMYLD